MSPFPKELQKYETIPGTYFDALPISIMTTQSLSHLQSYLPDYIIRMKDLDGPEEEPEKKVSKLRTFLGKALKNPLVVDFSRDARSSFTTHPAYKRHSPEDEEE